MRGHVRSNAVAYVALFLAVGGGTAVAVSSGQKRASTVDGLSAARFTQEDGVDVATTKVLDLAGMRVRYSCDSNTRRKRGSQANLELDLRTTVDGAFASVQFTTGSDPAGSAFTFRDLDLNQGDDLDLDQGRVFGSGQAILTAPSGKVISLDYGFQENESSCVAHGVALGG